MLTEKELQVLQLRQQGLRQTEIATQLGITQGAVSRFEARAKAKIRDALTDLAILERLGIAHDQAPYGVDEKLRGWKR